MAGNANSGRIALPKNVHLLRNNPSKLTISELMDGVRPEAAIPDPGAHIAGVARVEYFRVANLLLEKGCVTEWDKGPLEVYAYAYGQWVACVQHLNGLGLSGLTTVTPKGFEQLSSWTILEGRYADQMKKFALEFGLTPSARGRVQASPQMELFGDQSAGQNDQQKQAQKYLDR